MIKIILHRNIKAYTFANVKILLKFEINLLFQNLVVPLHRFSILQLNKEFYF